MNENLIHGLLRYCLAIVIVHYALLAGAQMDSVVLPMMEIKGDPVHLFANGDSYRKIEINSADQNLTDALVREGNIYFKSYGNQQLSTIAMRGTSANQTNVLWHGIPANYPTLGQMDFSQWSAWLLSSIELQAGNGGALFGSGAIGGTVLLDSNEDLLQAENGITLRGDLGSFGYSFYGAKSKYGSEKIAGSTKIYRTRINNNFPYRQGAEEIRQENAGSLDYGFQQQAQWSLGKHRLEFDGMFTRNEREVQPAKGATNEDFLETQNARVAVTHKYVTTVGTWNTTLAYLNNSTLYNFNQRTASQQYSIFSIYVFELGSNSIVRVGFNSNAFEANSANFREDLSDFRTGIFGSIRSRLTSIWEVSVNLRQSIFNGRYPFTPSFNQSFRLLETRSSSLTFQQSVSTGFRFPTLNDLYWAPGGNPNLVSESSWSLEMGLNWERRWERTSFQLQVNGYRMRAKDYILWRPGESFWSPENLQEVHIDGLEVELNLEVYRVETTQRLNGSYAFTRSLNQSGNNSGKQLPYVPVHQFTMNYEVEWSSWSAILNGNYTGRRFTNLDNTLMQSVDGFFLLDFIFSKEIVTNKWQWELGLSVRNLLSADYENLINRAMPGRNFQLSLIINR